MNFGIHTIVQYVRTYPVCIYYMFIQYIPGTSTDHTVHNMSVSSVIDRAEVVCRAFGQLFYF